MDNPKSKRKSNEMSQTKDRTATEKSDATNWQDTSRQITDNQKENEQPEDESEMLQIKRRNADQKIARKFQGTDEQERQEQVLANKRSSTKAKEKSQCQNNDKPRKRQSISQNVFKGKKKSKEIQ